MGLPPFTQVPLTSTHSLPAAISTAMPTKPPTPTAMCGPLITALTGRYSSRLTVPMTLVPGTLDEKELDRIT